MHQHFHEVKVEHGLVLPENRGFHFVTYGPEQSILLALDEAAVVSTDGEHAVVATLETEQRLARSVGHDGPIVSH